ncbi:MAG: ribosome hibernation-promoting factor, HPF/YfiA family [Actinomycetota bacterium]
MDLVVKGRGDRVSGQTRGRVERKLGRLSRLDRRIARVEVEVIRQPSRRVDGGHRVEASCRSSRRTFRASATGADVDSALDRVVERLERQIAREQDRRRSRMLDGANRIKSRRHEPS